MVSDDPETSADLDGDGLWDSIASYLNLSRSAYSPAADEQQRSSGQTIPVSDMTLNDTLRLQHKANAEAAKGVQTAMETLDPSPGHFISTLAGRAAGTTTNGDVAMSFASIGLSAGVGRAIGKAQNILAKVFNPEHFQAAQKEAQGIVVALGPDGKPFDHIGEIRQSLNGLKNSATTLTNALKDSNLSQAGREAIQNNLRQINSAINETLAFFKRNKIPLKQP